MTDQQLKQLHMMFAEGQAMQSKQIAIIIALLSQKLPNLSPEERKALENSSKDNLAMSDSMLNAVKKIMSKLN